MTKEDQDLSGLLELLEAELPRLDLIIGANLTALRVRRMLTIEQISARTGLSTELINQYEMGEAVLNQHAIAKLAWVYDLHPMVLYTRLLEGAYSSPPVRLPPS